MLLFLVLLALLSLLSTSQNQWQDNFLPALFYFDAGCLLGFGFSRSSAWLQKRAGRTQRRQRQKE